jgi:hypothetical protein
MRAHLPTDENMPSTSQRLLEAPARLLALTALVNKEKRCWWHTRGIPIPLAQDGLG